MGVEPVAVQRTAEVVRGGDKQLPQHVRFLIRRQRFRIDRMNVCT